MYPKHEYRFKTVECEITSEIIRFDSIEFQIRLGVRFSRYIRVYHAQDALSVRLAVVLK